MAFCAPLVRRGWLPRQLHQIPAVKFEYLNHKFWGANHQLQPIQFEHDHPSPYECLLPGQVQDLQHEVQTERYLDARNTVNCAIPINGPKPGSISKSPPMHILFGCPMQNVRILCIHEPVFCMVRGEQPGQTNAERIGLRIETSNIVSLTARKPCCTDSGSYQSA